MLDYAAFGSQSLIPFAQATLLKHEREDRVAQMASDSSGGRTTVLFGRLVDVRVVVRLAVQFSLPLTFRDFGLRWMDRCAVAITADLCLRGFLDLQPDVRADKPEVFYLATHSSVVEPFHRLLDRDDPRIFLRDLTFDQRPTNLWRSAFRRVFLRLSSDLEALIRRFPAQIRYAVELSRRLDDMRRHYSCLLHGRRNLCDLLLQ